MIQASLIWLIIAAMVGMAIGGLMTSHAAEIEAATTQELHEEEVKAVKLIYDTYGADKAKVEALLAEYKGYAEGTVETLSADLKQVVDAIKKGV